MEIRVWFEKLGQAKYISHLDLYRFMGRLIKRSRLPVWYTEGYNPHLYLTFALPLSLGFESVCESMDMRLVTPLENHEIAERLNSIMPQGLRIIKITPQVMNPKVICYAIYEITLTTAAFELEKLKEFLSLSEILIIKKSKKGDKQINIAKGMKLLTFQSSENEIKFDIRLAAGNISNINPSLLIEAIKEKIDIEVEYFSIVRKELLTEQLENFI